MKPVFKFGCCIIFLSSLLFSCSKSNDQGSMIPSSAMVVAHLDIKSMESKLSWNDIKATSWFQKMAADTMHAAAWTKKILDNPSASGIDFDKGLIFFVDKGNQTDYYSAVEGSIKNQSDFESFNKNFEPAQTVKTQGDIKVLVFKNNHVVGWNGNHFVYVMNFKTTAREMAAWKQHDSTLTSGDEDGNIDLSAFCTRLFSLKSDSSLQKNSKFSDLLKQNGDIHVWQNTDAIMKSTPTAALGMLKLDAFFQDNISTYTVNFEAGKIKVDQKGFAGKELTDILKKYMSGKINTGSLKNIPSQNVFAVFSMNFQPEGIRQLIQLSGTDGIINMYAQKLGFNLDDVVKASDGEYMLAFTDLSLKTDSSGINTNVGTSQISRKYQPEFNALFSTGINDKPSLQKLINAAKQFSSFLKSDSILNVDMNDKTFAFSNSLDYAKKYLAGGNNNFDFVNKISGHPVGLFIDFHKILSLPVATSQPNDEATQWMDKSVKMWDNLYMTGGDYENSGFTATTTVNLVDQKTNSLKQLNSYFNDIFIIHEEKAMRHEQKMDSLLTPPPIDTVKVK
jgi:Domain of unknown function (DUF4836)